MVHVSRSRLDATFAALSDPTRRAMLARLRGGRLRITDLARPLPMSLAAASKHIQVLERSGLVTRSVRGRDHHVSLSAGALDEAARWMAAHRAFWQEDLGSLSSLLGEPSAPQD